MLIVFVIGLSNFKMRYRFADLYQCESLLFRMKIFPNNNYFIHNHKKKERKITKNVYIYDRKVNFL